jgi:hypothetical protein
MLSRTGIYFNKQYCKRTIILINITCHFLNISGKVNLAKTLKVHDYELSKLQALQLQQVLHSITS